MSVVVFAASSDIAVVVGTAVGIALAAAWVGVIAVNFAKGKPWFGVFGLFGAFWTVAGAIRLAKPGSWWAGRYYDEGGEKLKIAHLRHPTYDDKIQAREGATALRSPQAATTREAVARSRTTPGEWRCRVCGLEFDTWDDGIAHYETIHPDGPAASISEKHGRVFVAGLQALEQVDLRRGLGGRRAPPRHVV